MLQTMSGGRALYKHDDNEHYHRPIAEAQRHPLKLCSLVVSQLSVRCMDCQCNDVDMYARTGHLPICCFTFYVFSK